jgi:hypothetical protein
MFALVKPDLRTCTRLLSVAAAARRLQLAAAAAGHCCCTQLPLLLALLCSLLLALLCSLLLSLRAASGSSIGSLRRTVLLATWIFAPRQRNLPQAGEKDERRFEKCHLCSRVPQLPFHVQAVLVSCQEQRIAWRDTGLNAAWCRGHGSSTQVDCCGLSLAAGPARHVVFCGHRSIFSSPPGRRVSPPRIFSTNPHAAALVLL